MSGSGPLSEGDLRLLWIYMDERAQSKGPFSVWARDVLRALAELRRLREQLRIFHEQRAAERTNIDDTSKHDPRTEDET